MVEQVDGCPVCEGTRPMAFMLTQLRPPITVQSCVEDIAVNLITMLARLQEVDSGWLYGVIEEAINLEALKHEAMAGLVTELQQKVDAGVLTEEQAGEMLARGSVETFDKPKRKARPRTPPLELPQPAQEWAEPPASIQLDEEVSDAAAQ